MIVYKYELVHLYNGYRYLFQGQGDSQHQRKEQSKVQEKLNQKYNNKDRFSRKDLKKVS